LDSSYIQHFEDPEAVSAVNDIEDLTSGLSRKIWQKMMVLPSVANELPVPIETIHPDSLENETLKQ